MDHDATLDTAQSSPSRLCASDLPIFLGVAERAATRANGWDLLGLNTLVAYHFFPSKTSSLTCVLAIPFSLFDKRTHLEPTITFRPADNPAEYARQHLNIEVSRPGRVATTELSLSEPAVVALDPAKNEFTYEARSFLLKDSPNGVKLFAFPAPPLLLRKPTTVLVEATIDGIDYPLGHFGCLWRVPKPIGDEERRALESKPANGGAIVAKVGCKKCGELLHVFTTLVESDSWPKHTPADAVRLEKVSDIWACSCGASTIDMRYMKAGLQSLFRHDVERDDSDAFAMIAPLYEANALEQRLKDFEALLDCRGGEEVVQQFLQKNPIFWSFLSPKRILHKPPILAKKKADFAVLGENRVLYIIEIEKPSTKLINKQGKIAEEINVGKNQIHDWEMTISEYRQAVIQEMGLALTDVDDIRFILVGGLARKLNGTGLMKIRRHMRTPIMEFYCFDELASFVNTLIMRLRRL